MDSFVFNWYHCCTQAMYVLMIVVYSFERVGSSIRATMWLCHGSGNFPNYCWFWLLRDDPIYSYCCWCVIFILLWVMARSIWLCALSYIYFATVFFFKNIVAIVDVIVADCLYWAYNGQSVVWIHHTQFLFDIHWVNFYLNYF